jgi:acyl-coenzyme A thioesterase PaaI-like protein
MSADPVPPLPDGASTVPPHAPTCMGCGPDAPSGYHLHPYRIDDRIIAEYTFGEGQAGAPGLAHGGAVAAICDDLLGHVLSSQRFAAVTRRLEVDYLKPVVLGEPHRLVAWEESEEGRKLWVRCEATGPDGGLRFTARGLFIRVGWEHFLAGLPEDERERAERKLAELRIDGKEPLAW